MIYDHLNHQNLYRNLHPRFAKAFDYLTTFDPATPDGKIELEGESLLAIIQSYESRDRATKKMESHRRYVDLQYMINGEETLYHRHTDSLTVKEAYDPERDVVFYEDADDQSLVFKPGDFTILFQHDGHKPSCIHRVPQSIRKIVFKISL